MVRHTNRFSYTHNMNPEPDTPENSVTQPELDARMKELGIADCVYWTPDSEYELSCIAAIGLVIEIGRERGKDVTSNQGDSFNFERAD